MLPRALTDRQRLHRTEGPVPGSREQHAAAGSREPQGARPAERVTARHETTQTRPVASLSRRLGWPSCTSHGPCRCTPMPVRPVAVSCHALALRAPSCPLVLRRTGTARHRKPGGERGRSCAGTAQRTASTGSGAHLRAGRSGVAQLCRRVSVRCTDPVQARQDVGEFFRRLREAMGRDRLPYVWVPELHKDRVNLHVHFAVGRFAPRSVIADAWGRRHVHIKLLNGMPVGSGPRAEARAGCWLPVEVRRQDLRQPNHSRPRPAPVRRRPGIPAREGHDPRAPHRRRARPSVHRDGRRA